MANITLEELQSENKLLRDLVVSLSVALLQNIALEPPKYRGNVTRADAEHLLEEAERCFRCAEIPGLEKEIAERLDAAGHELMARAVEIETTLQREKWQNKTPFPA
jgi:hypothetical protein